MAKTPPYLKISPELKKSIDCNKYTCIDNGTKEENVLCAIIILFAKPDVAITPKEFLKIYIGLVQYLYKGLVIKPEFHPEAKDSALERDARRMKGDETNNLLKSDSIKKIAKFITDGSISFESALDNAITEWEEDLLISAFQPSSPLG